MNDQQPSQTGVFPKRSLNAVRATRTVDTWSTKVRTLALKGTFVFILGIALGIFGPYGTYESVPIFDRLAFWTLIILIPWALWESLITAARKFLPSELGERKLMALLMPAFAVAGSLFATSFIALTLGLAQQSFASAWTGSLVSWLLFSFLIVLPLALIADALSRQAQRTGGENLLGFFSTKLPKTLQGSDLIALQSEGHYLRVFTSAGDDLILMSMDDAMSALSAYPGIRTHRSWWIAVDQIEPDFEATGAFTQIVTISGLQVPVSRRRRKLVREQLDRFLEE